MNHNWNATPPDFSRCIFIYMYIIPQFTSVSKQKKLLKMKHEIGSFAIWAYLVQTVKFTSWVLGGGYSWNTVFFNAFTPSVILSHLFTSD